MWASIKHLLALTILLAIGSVSRAEYDVNAYCQIVKDGTKLASIESCQTYYTCQKGSGTKQSCPANQAFDKSAQTCKSASQVKCYLDENPCANEADGAFIPVAGTCRGWIYCSKGKEAGRGECDSKYQFKDGQCRYGDCPITDDGETSTDTLQSACDVVPNNIYFGDFESCSAWHYCNSNNEHTSGNCPNNLNYNVQKAACTDEKCKLPDVNVTMPDDGTEVSDVCDSETDTIKAHSTICSAYYVCTADVWVKKACESGKYYDNNLGECALRQKATPVATCDRCEGSTQQFVNAVDSTCMEYLLCKNGVKVASTTKRVCGEDTFFNEALQSCVKASSTVYAEENGACASGDGETDPETDPETEPDTVPDTEP